jgi:hypothetical protein
MNPPIERPPLPPLDLPLPVVPAAAEGSASLAVSDCLYQLAALTAGAFLLATLV